MLVGRDAERRRLDALLATARLGRSGVLVLTGEAGIGKTALLADLAERAEGMAVLSVTGTEAERDLPFAALAQLLRVRAEDLERLPAPQAEALGVALALRAGAGADRFAVGAGLLTLLARRSEHEPLCLVVDDAQHLDTPSADALLFVARRLLADPIALVIAVRDDEPCRLADPQLPRLRLTGIDVDATRALVRAGGGRDSTVERVQQWSLGNPLAIRELAGDPAALDWGPVARTLPESLTRIYARRADDLSPAGLTAARCAALSADDLAVVASACARVGISVAVLSEAEDADLLRVDGDRVRFRHPLIRSALYAGASPSERRRLHTAIADAIGETDPDRRAWHRGEAALGPDEGTAAELEAYAERAAQRSAYAVAATAADRAAALSPDPAERARRLLAAGIWAWRAGEVARARSALDDAARSGSPAVRTRADHVRGVIAARSGSVEEALAILRRAAASAGDPVDALASLAEAVNACYYLGDAAGAVATADTIVALLDGTPGPDRDARARATIAAGCARILAGEDGGPLIRAGLDHLVVPDAGGEPALATWAVLGPLFLRDAGTGRDQMEHAVHTRRVRTVVGELPHLLFHVARDEAGGERWDRAEADYTEAIGLARELGQGTELAASLAGLAWLQARTGRGAEAVAHADEALALCATHQIRLMEVWASSALADLAYGDGEIQPALDRYLAVEQRLHELGIRDVDLSPVPEIVECRLRLGTGEVHGPAAAYADRAAAKGQPWAMARAARLTALLATDDELDTRFGAALRHHDETLDVFERARTLLAYGSRLRRARRRVDARAPLQEALDDFDRLGATPWAGAAADELTATGSTVTRPGTSPRSRLTPRELQIAVLLAEGRTTREAAGILFLSPKTVEYHLRNVYTKLGVATRPELARMLGSS